MNHYPKFNLAIDPHHQSVGGSSFKSNFNAIKAMTGDEKFTLFIICFSLVNVIGFVVLIAFGIWRACLPVSVSQQMKVAIQTYPGVVDVDCYDVNGWIECYGPHSNVQILKVKVPAP